MLRLTVKSPMKTSLFSLLSVLLVLMSSLHAEFRVWSSVDGKTVDAELVKVEGDNITFRLRSGVTTTFAESKLSEADRSYIKKNPPAVVAAKPTATKPAESRPALGSTAAPTKDRKAKWHTKLSKAQDEAKETGLPILVLFTGSTWCGYCVKLEGEVFAEKDFKKFADEHLILLKLDFGPGGSTSSKEHSTLKTQYGVRGFPTYFLTDAAGTKLAQGGYNNGINPAKFADWVTASTPKKS